MARRMSCSITIAQVRDRSKTVTRRHEDTWVDLAAGDELILIEKGMGLPRGAKQVVIGRVRVTSVRLEPLGEVTAAEITAEGFDGWAIEQFIAMWAAAHGYGMIAQEAAREIVCRRIEWEYIG